MHSVVVQRIRVFLKANGISVNALSKELGMPQSTLSGQLNSTTGLSLDILSRILDKFPDLSAEWLLRGTEPMTITAQPSESDEKLRAICIEQLKKIYDLESELAELKGEREVKHA